MLRFESTKIPALTLNNIFNFKKNPSVTTGNDGSKRVCVWAGGAAPGCSSQGGSASGTSAKPSTRAPHKIHRYLYLPKENNIVSKVVKTGQP